MFAITIALIQTAFAAEFQLSQGGIAIVERVVDGDTVILDRNLGSGNVISNEVRLVGIQAPKLPLGRKNFKTWPLADTAKTALEKLTLNKKVRLSYGGRRMDRHGRLLAHLHLSDGKWVQAELLRGGMARVYSFPDNRAKVGEMLKHENIARRDRRGIWRHPFYYIRKDTELGGLKSTFQVIEGKVLDVATVRKKTYINFGGNWRTDFTISLNARAQRLFAKSGFDPVLLKDKHIRVRGWIKFQNGPMINATHPEQIEVLNE